MRKSLTFVVTTLVGVLFIAPLYGCQKEPSPTEMKIGVIVPLTGAAADFGKWARTGIELAIADVNSSNPHGRKVQALYEDSQMDTKTGLTAFKKLVDVDKVAGVITSGSGVVLAIAPEAERTRIVQLNHAAVSPAIRKAGRYTFTLVNDADVETNEIARLAYTELNFKEMAILYANAAYGVGTKDAIAESFTRLGGRIIGTVAFPENFTDARAQILELQGMSPPAVYFVATIKDSGRLLKQSKELGLKTQWLTYNAFESPEVLQIAGDAADGVVYTSSNLFDLPNPGPEAKRFLESYLAKYGERPNLYAATAYDAVRLLVMAHDSANGAREQIQQALSTVQDYQGASGAIAFDGDGYVHKGVFLKTVRDGAFGLYSPPTGGSAGGK